MARVAPSIGFAYLGSFTEAAVPEASRYPLQWIFVEAPTGDSLGEYQYSNGAEWVSFAGGGGGGGDTNWDGGFPSSVYGGTTPLDGGTASTSSFTETVDGGNP